MTIIPNQPALPEEGNYTDAERGYVNDQPPDLFPENQDSNFGLKRKLWTDRAQEGIEQINTIWNELFVKTSSLFLDEWERQMGLPMAPPGITIGNRRARVLARVMRGPFTRNRVMFVIDTFLEPAIGGDAIQLVPQGVEIPPIGLPLYSGVADIESIYRIYENPATYTYEVWVRSEVTPDVQLDYELRRITPAGYTLIYRNDLVDILDMRRTVISDGPVAYLRMGTSLADISAFAAGVTNNGTTVMAAPGLLVPQSADGDGARIFNGTQWVEVAYVPNQEYNLAQAYSFQMQINALPAAGNFGTIISKAAGQPYIRIDDQGALRFGKSNSGDIAHTRAGLQPGVKYSVVVQYDDFEPQIFIDKKSDVTVVDAARFFYDNTAGQNAPWQIGRGYGGDQYFNGVLDEFAIFNKKMTMDDIIKHANVPDNNYARSS
jgi:hypothetical protein